MKAERGTAAVCATMPSAPLAVAGTKSTLLLRDRLAFPIDRLLREGLPCSLTVAEGHRRARGLLWGRLRGVSSRMADSAPMEVRRGGGRPLERRQRCPGRAARGGPFRATGQQISSSPGAAHAPASSAAASGAPLPPSRPYCAALQALTQVEQAQPVEEKKGKAKTSGKRFEIKKWNAVAM